MTKGNASRDASRSSPRGKASNEGVVFDGFTLTSIETDEVTIRLRHGGSGPPLLLLHGFPQTHAMWSKVAPRLAEHYTVVCPDLRGYGGSSKPASSDNHETRLREVPRRGSRSRRALRVSPGARFTGDRRETRGAGYRADGRHAPSR